MLSKVLGMAQSRDSRVFQQDVFSTLIVEHPIFWKIGVLRSVGLDSSPVMHLCELLFVPDDPLWTLH